MAAWQAKYDQTMELKMAKRELEEDLAASRREHATKMEAWQAKWPANRTSPAQIGRKGAKD
jgi:hypothetical protein